MNDKFIAKVVKRETSKGLLSVPREHPIRQVVFKMTPPYLGETYCKFSQTNVLGTWETYIFACDANGDVKEWIEMDGSVRNEISPEDLAESLGYRIEE